MFFASIHQYENYMYAALIAQFHVPSAGTSSLAGEHEAYLALCLVLPITELQQSIVCMCVIAFTARK